MSCAKCCCESCLGRSMLDFGPPLAAISLPTSCDAAVIRERERVLGIIEAKMTELWRTGRVLWITELRYEMDRIRSGAIAESMTMEEFSKELDHE